MKVPVITREDKEAVLYLSMLQKINAIHAGMVLIKTNVEIIME